MVGQLGARISETERKGVNEGCERRQNESSEEGLKRVGTQSHKRVDGGRG